MNLLVRTHAQEPAALKFAAGPLTVANTFQHHARLDVGRDSLDAPVINGERHAATFVGGNRNVDRQGALGFAPVAVSVLAFKILPNNSFLKFAQFRDVVKVRQDGGMRRHPVSKCSQRGFPNAKGLAPKVGMAVKQDVPYPVAPIRHQLAVKNAPSQMTMPALGDALVGKRKNAAVVSRSATGRNRAKPQVSNAADAVLFLFHHPARGLPVDTHVKVHRVELGGLELHARHNTQAAKGGQA